MKASPRQQQLLLDLQDLDNATARLRRRRTQLPERKELLALQGHLTQAKDHYMAVQRELDAQRADIARFESDVETVRARRSRDAELLAKSTSPKEATALQSELDLLARRQSELEDRELELMETNEETLRRFEVAAQSLSDVDATRERLVSAITASEAQIDAELASTMEHRSGLAAELQRDVLDHYEQLRERIGIGAARLRGKVSEASNMELAPAELAGIIALPEDELAYCPQTGAILVRVSE